MTWHADPSLLDRYTAGALDEVAASSVELHLSGCAECRVACAPFASPDLLEEVWDAVRVEIVAPHPRLWQRALAAVGVPEDDLVAVKSSTGLSLPWALSVIGLIVCMIVAGLLDPFRQTTFFLCTAPLLPALTVAGAYDVVDPLRELIDTTPFSGLRLTLLRALAATLAVVPVTVALGLAVPGLASVAARWVAPAAAVLALTLLLLERWSAPVSGAVVAGVWGVVAVAVLDRQGVEGLTSTTAQVVSLVVAALAAARLVRTTTQTRTTTIGTGGM